MPVISRTTSTHAPGSVAVGIVHLGLGAFHRAHQAVYVERNLSRHRGGDWGICAANFRSNAELPDQLEQQHGRYHVVAFSNREQVEITEVRSIRRALFAGEDKTALLDRMTRPSTRIVSLTVTEKGYHLNPATGELLHDDDAVIHDCTAPKHPMTAAGLIVEAAHRRRELGHGPFTVLSCDNMPDNGTRTRRAVIALAGRRDRNLATWIEDEVAFPSTMVDRIVPAMTDQRRADAERLIGEPDAAAIVCESFSQWVIEDRFSAGRPDWEFDGVEMVDDVAAFETLKLRLLNGAHSLLAYAGLARGRTTVAEAMADAVLPGLVRDYFAEAARTLPPTPGIDPSAYADSLLARFANDALEHRLSQIAIDGSQKLPQRWLTGALANLARGEPCWATARGVAAWLAYVRGENARGDKWTVDDPMAGQLADCHRKTTSATDAVDALLGIERVFPPRLASSDPFRNAVIDAYLAMMEIERRD